MKGEDRQNEVLTDEERRLKLSKLIAHRLSEQGKMHLPTARAYNSLSSDEGLSELFRDFCRWLGIKPSETVASYSATTNSYNVSDGKVQIAEAYRYHPFAAGTLLAMGAMSYYLEKQSHEIPNQAFLEFATIETGLCLWILNGMRPRIAWHQSLYHIFDGSWVHREGIALSDYSPVFYAHKVVEYAHQHRIPVEEYIGHISSRQRYLLPEIARSSLIASLPDPDVVHKHARAAKLLWVRLFLVTSIIAIAICIGLYAYAVFRPNSTAVQNQQKDALQIIKTSYDSCVLKATGQQNTYDPNDMFLTRQTDATRSRCESLRNEYNYALDQYQMLYSNNQ